MARDFMSEKWSRRKSSGCSVHLMGSWQEERKPSVTADGYMYQLRMYEKKGKQLEAQGITLKELEEMAGDVYD